MTSRDRALLFSCLGLAVVLILLLALFTPNEEDATPSSYNTDTHGAKAAYLTLAQSGYQVERWTRPMNELGAHVDAHTVFISSAPDGAKPTAEVVRAVLDHGGRVLVVGIAGAQVLPDGAAQPGGHGPVHDCKGIPSSADGLSDIHLRTAARWTARGDRFHTVYNCEGLAVVVTCTSGRGVATWWADSLPLENAGIVRGDNLALLLSAVGPPSGAHIVWDEAPPSEVPSLWSYAEGTPIHLVWWQLALVAALLLVSVSRRSGPLRPDPVLSRAAPIEFVAAMGALYAKAHATNAAVTLAYRGFLERVDRYIPVRALAETSGAAAVAELLAARAGLPPTLKSDLVAAEAVRYTDPIPVRRALALVRALHKHEQALASAVGVARAPYTAHKPNTEERAS
jgi:hypothetical protein